MSLPGEHRLNTVKKSAAAVFGFAVYSIARMKYENPLWSLFAIYAHLPKLKVAGSIPIRALAPAGDELQQGPHGRPPMNFVCGHFFPVRGVRPHALARQRRHLGT